MILYHTSDRRIEHPDISFSRAYLDFGKGIYTTPNRGQAEKYAKRFFKEERPAFLNIFELDDDVFNTLDLYMADLIPRDEAIKRLRKKKPNWQICLCNQTLIDKHLHFVESIELKNDAS